MPDDPYASFSSRVIPLPAENVDTDQIVPARYLKVTDKAGLGEALFRDWRFEADGSIKNPAFVLDQPEMVGRRILLAGDNFGCGSSREHAPQGLHRWGIDAVIGESFAEIFFGNSVMIGMPCVTAAPADVRALMDLVEKRPATEVTIDLVAGTCEADGFRCAISMPPNARDAFTSGAWDTTAMLLDHYEQVDAAAARLPYVAGF